MRNNDFRHYPTITVEILRDWSWGLPKIHGGIYTKSPCSWVSWNYATTNVPFSQSHPPSALLDDCSADWCSAMLTDTLVMPYQSFHTLLWPSMRLQSLLTNWNELNTDITPLLRHIVLGQHCLTDKATKQEDQSWIKKRRNNDLGTIQLSQWKS